jgi:ABC-type sugar transport system ATPase subunit
LGCFTSYIAITSIRPVPSGKARVTSSSTALDKPLSNLDAKLRVETRVSRAQIAATALNVTAI